MTALSVSWLQTELHKFKQPVNTYFVLVMKNFVVLHALNWKWVECNKQEVKYLKQFRNVYLEYSSVCVLN